MPIFSTTINSLLNTSSCGRLTVYSGNDTQINLLNIQGSSYIPWTTHQGSVTLRIEAGNGMLKYVEDNRELLISLAPGTLVIIPKGIPYYIQNVQFLEHLKIYETLCSIGTVSFNLFS